MTVRMIWAEARGRVIGADGGIPWRVPGEQALFKDRTLGSTIVMGRATWDSLPRRPLPGRRNVVLTRDPAWAADGAEVAHDVAEVLRKFDDFWVIGGESIYAAFIPFAEHIVRTEVDLEVDGDTFAPELGPQWRTETETGWRTADNGVKYRVVDYRRENP